MLDRIQLIIVNNGSLDDTQIFLKTYQQQNKDKYFEIVILNNETNLGFAIGNNQGAYFNRGHYLFFVNNDVVFYENCIQTFVDKYREKRDGTALMGARLLGIPGTPNPGGDGNTGWNMLHDKPVRYIEGWSLFMSCGVYAKLCLSNDGKLFDERFTPAYYEDVDLSLRAVTAGIELYAPSGLPIKHLGSQTSQKTTGFKFVAIAQANQVKFLDKWNHLTPEQF